ncbi:MAG: DUF4258 domain-containing protein [Armatimonadota bacterium]|nr:DUF4258 domain-containing protein [Armatimonadota bacterium]
MFERGVSADEVRQALASGEVIEDYPNDLPYPSRLILGWRGARPIHVVAAHDRVEDQTIVITVYEPDANLWESGFRRRRRT